jgi:hypothetical protein
MGLGVENMVGLYKRHDGEEAEISQSVKQPAVCWKIEEPKLSRVASKFTELPGPLSPG